MNRPKPILHRVGVKLEIYVDNVLDRKQVNFASFISIVDGMTVFLPTLRDLIVYKQEINLCVC